jgi:hypothetical protein
MNQDLDLERWQQLWQSETQMPAHVRGKAERQQRRSRWVLTADILVTIFVGGAVLLWAIVSKSSSVWQLWVWVGLTLLVAWVYRWFNRPGGNMSGAAPDTEAFLNRLRASYRRSLQSIWFGWGLGVVQIAVNAAWVYRELTRSNALDFIQFLLLPSTLVVGLMLLGLFGWSIWFHRKLKGELTELEVLMRSYGVFTGENGSEWLEAPELFLDRLNDLTRGLGRRRKRRNA